MAKENKDCPWMEYKWGVPICRLMVLPCERVSPQICDQKKEKNKNDSKT